MSYGYCPLCCAPGVSRERRPHGNDVCENGHTYASAVALSVPRVSHSNLEKQIAELAAVIMSLDLRGKEDGGACQIAAIRMKQLAQFLEDLKPIVRYVRARRKAPLYGLGDVVHAVNIGTDWEASLLLTDLEKVVANPIICK